MSEVEQGHYARKQIACSSHLISWSHRQRFATGLRLVKELGGQRILDYGSGDGTFLALWMQSGHAPPQAIGAEVDDRLVAECRQRFQNVPGLEFCHVRDLTAMTSSFEGVVCMEVLEHVVQLDALLDQFHSLLRPGGWLLISVPVEIGLPLLVKQAARCIAGWRGLGDYPGTSPYTTTEYARSFFAGDEQHIVRPVLRNPDGFESHDHKGFNWRLLRTKVAARFELLQTHASPIDCLTPHLGSQAWFVARKR